MVGIALGIMMLFMAIGMPVAIAITGSTLYYYITKDDLPTNLVFQAFVSGIESFPLLAIPFFILAGELMNAAGMTSRLINFADSLFGHLRGGLAHVNVITNTMMGGMSGSANADAAALSKVLVPEMEKRGYDRAWSSALTAAGAVIGPIIPPGIGLILFGLLANVSIGRLFIGGIVPGILLCLALMVVVYIISRRRGYKVSRENRAPLKVIWASFINASLSLFLPVLIVGGIRFGIFTHTEAASMAVMYALFVGVFLYRTIKFKDICHVLANTVQITGIIMLIVAAASSLGRMLSWERIPHQAAEFMSTLSSNPYIILLIINVVLLILGCFAEGTANLIIMTPLLVPIIDKLGVDPVAFGVMMVLNLTIGGVTPPLGTLMYTVCSINKISTTDYTKQIWPFVIALVSVLFLITYVPQLVTLLPNLLMNE